ncbi:MAG: hypothetical protein K2X77_12975 [Candidatus Obscuribacterales bacterium]|jgi:hypothetical protein|nr:hypothetical protein [Candidatus Obscuribacterales bacterium]
MPEVDLKEFKKAAEEGQGCKLRDMLTDIPNEEHLSIIREFKRNEANNPKIEIQIKDGSKENDFEFAIYKKGAVKKSFDIDNVGKLTDRHNDQFRSKFDDILDQINNGKNPNGDPIFKEKYVNKGGFVAINNKRIECSEKPEK